MKTSESKYAKCMYFTSNALARKMERLAMESWKKVDLSPSHAYLLLMAVEQPGLQPSELVAELQLAPSTITRLIEKLETKKLVTRTTEGKITNVFATARAKELYPRLRQCVQEFNSKYNELIGREESARLVNSMAKVADKLDD